MSSLWVEATDPKTGRVYYYNKTTKSTQWTRPAELDGGAASTSSSSSSPSSGSINSTADPASDPKNWAEGNDPKTGKVYYYNKITKQTSWNKPAALGGTAAGGGGGGGGGGSNGNGEGVSGGSSSSSSASAPASSSAAAGVRPEWCETKDPNSGRSYWYNRITKETTWKNPYESGLAGSSSSAPNSGPNSGNSSGNSSPTGSGSGGFSSKSINGIAGVPVGQPQNYSTIHNVVSSAHASAAAAFANGNEDENQSEESKIKNIRSYLRDEDSDEEEEGGGKGESDEGKQKAAHQDRHQDLRRQTDTGDDDEDEGHEFRFAKHRKGWFNRAFRLGEAFDETRLLTFKKSLIKKALLKQNRDLDTEAVQCFKNIMSYMGDRKSSKPPIEHSKKMLRNLMIAPSGLRDEVYMQLCKQTTGNPNMESTVKGWQLMSFCLATFPPSKHLKSFLLDYIKKNSEDSSKPGVQELARLCYERLPTIVAMGQRKQVPSTLELQCLMDSKPVPIRVNLANGTFKTFTVDPYTTNADVEDLLVKKYNLTVISPFSLYESAEANVERILDPKDRVLDVVASWENKPLVEEVKVDNKKEKTKSYEKVPKQQLTKVVQKEIHYNSLLYKAKLVLKTTNAELMSDPEAVNLIYIQATQDVVTQRYPSNDKDITVLAALQLQATYGDYKKEVHVPGWLKPKIEEFMPVHLLEKKGKKNDALVAEWEQKILAKYMKVSGFTSLEAKLNYLDYVQEWVFYGSTFFMVEQRQFKDYPSPLTLGINCEGVLLMHPEKKTVLENYQYTDIVTWGHSDEKFIVVVGNIVQQRKLIFKTNDGKSMNHLIHDYVKFKVKNKEVGNAPTATAM